MSTVKTEMERSLERAAEAMESTIRRMRQLLEENAALRRQVETMQKRNCIVDAAGEEMAKVLVDIEMETRAGGQWTREEINEVARRALRKEP